MRSKRLVRNYKKVKKNVKSKRLRRNSKKVNRNSKSKRLRKNSKSKRLLKSNQRGGYFDWDFESDEKMKSLFLLEYNTFLSGGGGYGPGGIVGYSYKTLGDFKKMFMHETVETEGEKKFTIKEGDEIIKLVLNQYLGNKVWFLWAKQFGYLPKDYQKNFKISFKFKNFDDYSEDLLNEEKNSFTQDKQNELLGKEADELIIKYQIIINVINKTKLPPNYFNTVLESEREPQLDETQMDKVENDYKNRTMQGDYFRPENRGFY